MRVPIALLRLLADGELHTGPELAAAVGCSRAAVSKQLQALPGLGLAMESAPGRGYRLLAPLELLDPAQIRAALGPECAAGIDTFIYEPVMDSTSERLRAAPAPAADHMHVAIAEFQTGGRGRRGRSWLSPFGAGLCLSVAWVFDGVPGGMAGLSLALGVAVQTALADAGIADVQLKWPNDLVSGDRKLGGLLVDMAGEAGGPLNMVAGLGLNLRASPELPEADADSAALAPICADELGGAEVGRNALASAILQELFAALERYQAGGFTRFADAWRQLDALHGRPVQVQVGEHSWQGTARGIAGDGALLVERGGRLEAVLSGEVSIRPAS